MLKGRRGLYFFIVLYLFGAGGCRVSIGSSDEVKFCQNVTNDLECIEEKEEYRVGKIYSMLSASENFGVDNLKVTLYLINGKSEKVHDSGEYEVSPEWDTFAIDVTLPRPGEYRVEFQKPDGSVIASGKVKIIR